MTVVPANPPNIASPVNALIKINSTASGTSGAWIITSKTDSAMKNISMNGINPPMEVVARDREQAVVEDTDVVGFTCIEGDVLQKNYSGPLAIGDYIVISNCGSYSLVMKPPFILPNFPVLDINGETVEVIKRAETFDDLFHTFSF